MPLTAEQTQWFSHTFAKMVANVEQAILGKAHVVQLVVTCLLAEGHLLLDDVPGTGKTSLAKALARTVQGGAGRIQFTPDLLPSDVTGSTIYDQKQGTWEFRPGPIFATIVLADEINRASPKTQSALLEAMEEGQVTIDGVAHGLGRPFMVIATQNPIEQAGTYPLPEAQLDRFLMRTRLGAPDLATTVNLLAEASIRDRTASLRPVVSPQEVTAMAELAANVHADRALLGYVGKLAEATRHKVGEELLLGVSVRGCLALVRTAKTWAAANGRAFIIPDDVKNLVQPVMAHRLLLTPDAEFAGVTAERVLEGILEELQPPDQRGVA